MSLSNVNTWENKITGFKINTIATATSTSSLNQTWVTPQSTLAKYKNQSVYDLVNQGVTSLTLEYYKYEEGDDQALDHSGIQ
jgi:hypothetical protein